MAAARPDGSDRGRARATLDGVARDSETLGGSTTARAAAKARSDLGIADEPEGWPEIWGRRVGRGLGWALLALLGLWLAGQIFA